MAKRATGTPTPGTVASPTVTPSIPAVNALPAIHVMTEKAGTLTYDQFIASGWKDADLIGQGYMLALAPVIPPTPPPAPGIPVAPGIPLVPGVPAAVPAAMPAGVIDPFANVPTNAPPAADLANLAAQFAAAGAVAPPDAGGNSDPVDLASYNMMGVETNNFRPLP